MSDFESLDTGGGSAVRGDANVGGGYIGRDINSGIKDSSQVVQFFNDRLDKTSDQSEIVNIITLALFGNDKLNIAGIIKDLADVRKSIGVINREVDNLKLSHQEEIKNRQQIIQDVKMLEEVLTKYTKIYQSFDTKILSKFSSIYFYILLSIFIAASTMTIMEKIYLVFW